MISEQVLQSIVESSTDSRAVDAIGQLVSRIHELEAALRQPQAARLTEEEREKVENAKQRWNEESEVGELYTIIERLTAAPAPQVTREEIGLPSCTLVECPVGLFMHGETLAFKSEYVDNNGRIEAYIVSSGEFFWGAAPQTIESQRAQIVTPIDCDAIMSLLASRGLVKGA